MAVGPGRIFAINLLANSDPAEKAFARVGKAAGRIPTPMKIAAAAITATFVAVTAVAVKVTKELFALGEAFNDSFRTIRVGTGATGAAFADLQDSFRNVAKAVPNDMGDIARAIAEVNTRTGSTGEELETLAKQFLTVSRLLGGDVQSNVRSVTRLFGDFAVEAGDQADVMNVLFRASQMTGAGFDTLADQTVQYGASLRNLGFTLPESIALLASFEKNGTNLETVMSGLRTAQAKLAETGKPLSVALADVIREIQTAETSTDALSIAMEVFGRRSGPDLADAIQSGRFSVGELVEAIANGSDTINAAADDTDGFREAWDNFKNYLKITLEPAANAVFGNLSALVAELKPATDRIVKAFEEDGLEGALEQVSIEWNKIYEEKIKPLFIKFLTFLEETVKPIALEVGEAIGEAIVSGMFKAVRGALPNLSEKFRDVFGSAVVDPNAGGRRSGTAGSGLLASERAQLQIMFGGISSGANVPTPGGPLVTYGDIPFMAAGGIVTSPTLAVIGEAGPEAVIPLDRAGGTGGGTINITVTSADPQAVVEALRRYTRANGPLGSVVSV